MLPLTAEVGAVATALQSALWSQGLGRSAGVMDLLHAAGAITQGRSRCPL